jgi:hypothetical protein
MKCFETEKNIDLLLDDEADELQKQQLKAHLAICESCQNELQIRQQSQILLQNQPPILPTTAFDKRMLALFENTLKAKQKPQKNWFTSLFTLPKPLLVSAAALLTLGIGFAFLVGRMSVASPPQLIISDVQNTSQPTETMVKPTPEIREVVVRKTEEKVITKYVNVPVMKEKIVERIVYLEKPKTTFKEAKKEVQTNTPIEVKDEDIAKQFNLKDLQPVANVSYKIIRKGEDNEK